MKKIETIVARTALCLLPLCVLSILLNSLLMCTPFGMFQALWQPSWIGLSLSIAVLFCLMVYESGNTRTVRTKNNA